MNTKDLTPEDLKAIAEFHRFVKACLKIEKLLSEIKSK